MARNVYRFKGNFKSFLFILAILITVGFLYYTQLLVEELQVQSREYLNLKVKIFEENINSEESADQGFVFTEIIQTADYPIIYTDAEMTPQFWRNVAIPQAKGPVSPDTLNLLQNMAEEFSKVNPPISISYKGNVLGYYFYGETDIIRQLRWLPFIEILVVAMFILIGYAGFNSIKKSEERSIWVGMAKETA
ncbi:hypothetical protein GWN26_00880, partial [Candidatus Saccharibacteria bacterium]|nr:hypothetical protein [Calditrichia bacterium]NIV97768.1 hypothetical protein [Candidatus Saccharibacteria bacterium]